MRVPFRNFRVKDTFLSGWGNYLVAIWPIGPDGGSGWMWQNRALNDEARQFIIDAIQEKLERETPHDKS